MNRKIALALVLAAAGAAQADDITPDELDTEVRAELLSLARPVADTVARHLVATGRLRPQALVTREIGLDDAGAALADMASTPGITGTGRS